MNHIYLFAVAAGATLLVASLLLGGKDTGHGGHDGHNHGDAAYGLGWAPVTSLRFWVFLCTFGGGAGLALTALGSSEIVGAGGALGIGWVSGVLAVAIVRRLTKTSVSSQVGAIDMVGATGTLLLPVGRDKPGKVRVEIKGRTEDFVAHMVDDAGIDGSDELATGTPVLIVAEGDRGSLLVAKHEM